VVRIVFAIQVFYFLVLGRKLVLNYNSRVSDFYSNLENKTISWVNYLLYSFVITSLMSVIFNIVGRSVFIENSSLLFIPSLIFSVLLFFIGYLGYLQDNVLIEMVTEEQKINPDNYSLSQKQLKEKLLELFEDEKIYTKNNLKITDLSVRLNTNRTYISGIINKEFNKSFNDFVNQYRINDAKLLLSNYSPHKYSLEYISELTGFGSLNTFIRTFKKFEGVTPGIYRDNAIAKKQM
jgi:AraC-like DNA-binding protein